jgi:hypothetical protein
MVQYIYFAVHSSCYIPMVGFSRHTFGLLARVRLCECPLLSGKGSNSGQKKAPGENEALTRGLLYRSNHVSPTYGDRYGVYTVHIIYCTYSTVLYSVEHLRSLGTYFLSCCSKPYHRRTFCYFQVPQQFKFVVFILFLINIITLQHACMGVALPVAPTTSCDRTATSPKCSRKTVVVISGYPSQARVLTLCSQEFLGRRRTDQRRARSAQRGPGGGPGPGLIPAACWLLDHDARLSRLAGNSCCLCVSAYMNLYWLATQS